MSWIDKILPSGIRPAGARRANVPEGVWRKCVKCEAMLYGPELERNLEVCPKCDHHMRIGARTRIDWFLDEQGREELATDVEPVDRLKFKDLKRYRDRLSAAQKSTGEKDALVVMRGTVEGLPVVLAVFEFGFHGGSMGYAVGEKFTRAANAALESKVPLVCFSATGGARMQEALISLMQMAKVSAILERLARSGIPYVSILTDPVYGGVSASLAMLGDINIAEPNARAGFAGPNIIEQTIRQKLPDGFQRSEFLLDKGAIDMIVHRCDMRNTVARLLAKMTRQPAPVPDISSYNAAIGEELDETDQEVPREPQVDRANAADSEMAEPATEPGQAVEGALDAEADALEASAPEDKDRKSEGEH